MIPASFKIEIEDASQTWQDVTESVERLTYGCKSEAEIVPRATIEFGFDFDELGSLLDPETNRDRARIRITNGDTITLFLLETQDGDVSHDMKAPTIAGKAYAGIVSNWRKVTHTWEDDTPASGIARQALCRDVANQAGESVGVVWQATLDPTIPGGRYAVTKVTRLEILKELAAACAADVRVSDDGRNFEIYDIPANTLTGTADRTFTNGISLSYRMERKDDPKNAVRVQGEVVEISRSTLPVVTVTVVPGAIDADGEDSASAVARVYDSSGQPVQHEAIVDEPITAGSYTEITVSGCFSVEGVWLNTGTQESPVKGAKVTPTSFTDSTITVPDNGTQLFIVSYTKAESVSWSSADVQKQIDGEAHTTTGTKAVSTSNAIGNVRGVYRATDTNRTGTNYYTGGSFVAGGTAITLGITPGAIGTAVIIDYDQYEATPSVNISPSSSLCDAEGKTTTTIGAGTSVGTVSIVASALGQSGSANLSLTGDDVDALSVTADPQTIRAKQSATASTTFTGEACQTAVDADGGIYVAVDNLVTYSGNVLLSGYGNAPVLRWTNNTTTDDYRIYIMTSAPAGVNASADYTGREINDEADQTSTITANVLTSAGEPVSDGTSVKFELIGATGGATLSAEQQTTSDGQASVTLTAGNVAQFVVQVTAGPYRAQVQITVTDQPLAANQTTGTATGSVSSGYSNPSDQEKKQEEKKDPVLKDGEYIRADGRICHLVLKDWEDASGNVRGKRQALNCDGDPIVFADYYIDGVYAGKTDAEGYFPFVVAEAGSHTVSMGETESSFSVAAGGEMRWTPGEADRWYEACHDQ